MAAYKIWMSLSNGKRAILENVLNATPYFLAFFTNDQLGRSRTRMEHVIVVVDCGQLVPTALSTLDGYSHQRGSKQRISIHSRQCGDQFRRRFEIPPASHEL